MYNGKKERQYDDILKKNRHLIENTFIILVGQKPDKTNIVFEFDECGSTSFLYSISLCKVCLKCFTIFSILFVLYICIN